MINWQCIENFPKEKLGELVLVHYDHDKDPYVDPNDPSRLTDYGALSESGDFCEGEGITFARWFPSTWESIDEYGNGYRLPAGWFVEDPYKEYSVVCNPTHWAFIEPPEEYKEEIL